MADFVLRAARGEDLPFIFNSFLKSYRDAPAVSGVPNTLYYDGQHALIERLLKDGKAIVACATDDPEQIMGYGIGGASVIHWIYVKHPFRGFGIGKALEGALVGQAPEQVFYTHRVKATDRLVRNRPYTFNPFLLIGK